MQAQLFLVKNINCLAGNATLTLSCFMRLSVPANSSFIFFTSRLF